MHAWHARPPLMRRHDNRIARKVDPKVPIVRLFEAPVMPPPLWHNHSEAHSSRFCPDDVSVAAHIRQFPFG